jgi:hypothetical protein
MPDRGGLSHARLAEALLRNAIISQASPTHFRPVQERPHLIRKYEAMTDLSFSDDAMERHSKPSDARPGQSKLPQARQDGPNNYRPAEDSPN